MSILLSSLFLIVYMVKANEVFVDLFSGCQPFELMTTEASTCYEICDQSQCDLASYDPSTLHCQISSNLFASYLHGGGPETAGSNAYACNGAYAGNATPVLSTPTDYVNTNYLIICVAALMVVNITFLMVYCYGKCSKANRNGKRYKMVSVNTDSEVEQLQV